MKKLAVCFLFVFLGCREPVADIPAVEPEIEMPESLQAAIAEPSGPSLDLIRAEHQIKGVLAQRLRDEITQRSCHEAAVKLAIEIVDQYLDLDEASRKILEENKSWYAAYRDCASLTIVSRERNPVILYGLDVFRTRAPEEKVAILKAALTFTEHYRKTDRVQDVEITDPEVEEPAGTLYSATLQSLMEVSRDRKTDEHAAIRIADQDLEAVSKRRPLFPAGTR